MCCRNRESVWSTSEASTSDTRSGSSAKRHSESLGAVTPVKLHLTHQHSTSHQHMIDDQNTIMIDDQSAVMIDDQSAVVIDNQSAVMIDDQSAIMIDDQSAVVIDNQSAVMIDDQSAVMIDDQSAGEQGVLRVQCLVRCGCWLCYPVWSAVQGSQEYIRCTCSCAGVQP